MERQRLTKDDLLSTLTGWSKFIKRKVRLIACGGTAMTLLGVKASTKDVDFMVPDRGEHSYLIRTLNELGYKPITPTKWQKDGEPFEIDLFCGNKIHTTELLTSPLEEGGHSFYKNAGRIYIGILNSYDLISSKIFRGTTIDFDDCLMLAMAKGAEIDKDLLIKHYKELAGYDVSEERIKNYIDSFIERWEREVKSHGK